MTLTRGARWTLGVLAAVVLTFIYLPLVVVVVNSFNTSKVFAWPPTGWTLGWWAKAASNDGVRAALLTSVKAATGATLIALILGSMVAFAVARYRWFGRDAISFLVILPIALPGIVTGIALNSAITTVLVPFGVSFGLFTVILGHATFCIVVVFNNIVARLRRTGTSLEEAACIAKGSKTGTVILVDAADATSSGASGDSNAILRALLDAGYGSRVRENAGRSDASLQEREVSPHSHECGYDIA